MSHEKHLAIREQPILIKATIHEIPFQGDTETLFSHFRHLPGALWLDSGKPRSLQGRFDIISALPEVTLTTRGNATLVVNADGSMLSSDKPFDTAWEILKNKGLLGSEYTHMPFVGGLMGYFAYDLGQHAEQRMTASSDSLADMHLGWYGWAVIVNHQSSKSWLVVHPGCNPATEAEVRTLLAKSMEKSGENGSDNREFILLTPFQADIDKTAYVKNFDKIHRYIGAGDCYQVNYALRHQAKYSGDPWHAYKALRRASPSPYSAYMPTDKGAILCCSPERFLKVSVGQVETKPIKGTCARGISLEEDQENAIRLLNSKKDRAENVMIVDLLRNDLSRNCATGSVRVPKLFSLESFANVHHLVSTITGTLAPASTPLDLLRDSFPGGSITGAPKKRAMEIIAELEPGRRGIYCGSIGYISATGRMDTNIAIRTLVAEQGTLSCWGGGGIVADSMADIEYEEALQKVRNLMTTLENMAAAQ
jgi:para-aminobenzoate synthetase component 1